MKNTLIALCCVLLLVACASPKSITMGNGSSFEYAVVIEETTESKGVDAEYKWIAENYPGYQVVDQRLTQYEKKPYDVIRIITAEGVEKGVYFDISSFFGHF